MNEDFVSIGKCLYCGTEEGELTKEHAIPYGLSGTLILHKASCRDCAKITSAFELSCLRGLLARTRARLNLKTRRPKPVTTVFKVDQGFGLQKTERDAKMFAGINVLPVFEPPAFLIGQKSEGGVKVCALDHLNLGNPIPIISVEKTTQVKIEYTLNLDVNAFARMIAKIGYCCAVAHLGLDKMSENYVIPSIVGTRQDVQTWVGSEDILFNPTRKLLHIVEVFVKEKIIFARVCLFAAFGGKPYTVVVGKFADSAILPRANS
jgi:hypothetical protein